MAVPGTTVEISFAGVVVNVPLVVAIQSYSLGWFEVRFGNGRELAVPNVDYTINYDNPVSPTYMSFNFTPLAPLMTKIAAAVGGVNIVYVSRTLPLTTDFDLDDAFVREKLVTEFDKLYMIAQQFVAEISVGTGDVSGPSGSTDDNPAVFAGNTGKVIREKTYAAFKGNLALTKADVGLGNVDNTSDLNKPISTATQAALDTKTGLVSPAFSGNPTAPTPAPGDNDTSIATTAFVNTALAGKADIASPVFTGNPTAPTPTAGDNDTSIATTAFVTGGIATAGALKADIASPTFTGDPKAPTPLTADNDTSIATTAFVKAQGYATLANPVFTGDPQAPTPLTADNDTSIATTAFVKAQAYAPLASPALTGTPTAPTAGGGTNTTQLATTAFVVAEVNSIIASADAMVYKGVIDCSANPNYPAANAGWTYKVSVAGKIGGAAGPNVEVGDTLLCTLDGSAAGNHATVGANWNIVQANLDGAVIGPASVTSGNPAVFSGTSGKLVAEVTFGAFKTSLALTKSDVGLGNVDNTSDVNKPVSTAQQTALNLKADLAGPTFTGVPAAPTAAPATNTTQLATTAFVAAADALKADLASPTFTGDPKAPTATAGDNDTSIATTAFVKNAVDTGDALKIAGPGTVTSGNPVVFSGTTGLAVAQVTFAAFKTSLALAKGDVGLGNVDNTSDVNKPVSTAQQTALNLKADLASPALTGNPTAPTASPGDNDTSIATTAFVAAAVLVGAPPATATPLVDAGAGAVGTATKYAREDHVHPPPGAAAIAFTPTGNIAANTVAAALAELDGEKIRQVVTQKFTASGTYTPTAGMLFCIVECVGGGGGGGGSASPAAGVFGGAGGGGSASYSRSRLTAAQIGASKAVAIGAQGLGGAAGNNGGNNGGDTTLGTTLVVAKGGGGGLGGSGVAFSTGGGAGAAGTGDIAYAGQTGGSAAYNGSSIITMSGYGAASFFGGGTTGITTNTATTGYHAGGVGSGGSGAASGNATGAAAGGNGSTGFMFITEFTA